jgi:hypothetical protein
MQVGLCTRLRLNSYSARDCFNHQNMKGLSFQGTGLKLVAELMENCHRGDKKFAQA